MCTFFVVVPSDRILTVAAARQLMKVQYLRCIPYASIPRHRAIPGRTVRVSLCPNLLVSLRGFSKSVKCVLKNRRYSQNTRCGGIVRWVLPLPLIGNRHFSGKRCVWVCVRVFVLRETGPTNERSKIDRCIVHPVSHLCCTAAPCVTA